MNEQIHRLECEEQAIGMPCICDHLADEESSLIEEQKEAESSGN